ncbi:MAG: FMN reductase [Arthrobacter sp.]
MAERRIVAVTAGLGVPSSSRMLADQLGTAAQVRLEELGHHAVLSIYELREYAVDIANAMVSGYAAPKLEALLNEVADADALIAVSPVFSASMSGLFKSFFDVMDKDALDAKPVLIGATGGSARHSMVLDFALRPLFAYLRARVAPTAVYAAPDDWGAGSGSISALDDRVQRAAADLVALLGDTPASRPRRDAGGSLPFEQLLAQIQPRG